jgi:hypothetical protein
MDQPMRMHVENQQPCSCCSPLDRPVRVLTCAQSQFQWTHVARRTQNKPSTQCTSHLSGCKLMITFELQWLYTHASAVLTNHSQSAAYVTAAARQQSTVCGRNRLALDDLGPGADRLLSTERQPFPARQVSIVLRAASALLLQASTGGRE